MAFYVQCGPEFGFNLVGYLFPPGVCVVIRIVACKSCVIAMHFLNGQGFIQDILRSMCTDHTPLLKGHIIYTDIKFTEYPCNSFYKSKIPFIKSI